MNNFHDINKFPKDWGIVVFPISMSKISNSQSPKELINSLDFLKDKILANKVGAHFVYSDGLYMNLEDSAYETKNRFAINSVSHMGGIRNLIEKNHDKFQIDDAFSFESWFQSYLSYSNFFCCSKKGKRVIQQR